MSFFKRYGIGLTLIISTILVLVFYSLDLSKSRQQNVVDRSIIWVVAPVQDFFTKSVTKITEVFDKYIFLTSLFDENKRLQNEYNLMSLKLNQMKEIEIENERLRDLLSLKKQLPYPVTTANIIGTDPTQAYQTIRLDKGQSDGVLVGMPVVSSIGLLGQILRISTYYSDVLLVTDANSAVSAVIQRNRVRGILEGYTQQQMRLRYIPKSEDVYVGDRVVTSHYGLKGVFPEGLLIGEVTELELSDDGITQNLLVKPMVDHNKLKEVFIVLNENKLLQHLLLKEENETKQ